MKNVNWTVTLGGKTQIFEMDYNRENGNVAIQGTTMTWPLGEFLEGLEKMRAAGAVIVEGTRL